MYDVIVAQIIANTAEVHLSRKDDLTVRPAGNNPSQDHAGSDSDSHGSGELNNKAQSDVDDWRRCMLNKSSHPHLTIPQPKRGIRTIFIKDLAQRQQRSQPHRGQGLRVAEGRLPSLALSASSTLVTSSFSPTPELPIGMEIRED